MKQFSPNHTTISNYHIRVPDHMAKHSHSRNITRQHLLPILFLNLVLTSSWTCHNHVCPTTNATILISMFHQPQIGAGISQNVLKITNAKSDPSSFYVRIKDTNGTLNTAGLYDVKILYEVKDGSAFLASEKEAHKVLQGVPEELRGLVVLWSEHQMHGYYPGLNSVFSGHVIHE